MAIALLVDTLENAQHHSEVGSAELLIGSPRGIRLIFVDNQFHERPSLRKLHEEDIGTIHPFEEAISLDHIRVAREKREVAEFLSVRLVSFVEYLCG